MASGALYFGAFPGRDESTLWPLAFIALVPLLVAIRGQTPRVSALFGVLAGVVMNLLGFSWLVPLLERFSGFPALLCWLLLALLALAHSLRIAIPCWLTARASARGWSIDIAFVLAFAASELVVPAVFRWNYAATVSSIPVLLQVAEIGGPILVGMVLVIVNLAIAEWIGSKLERRSASRRVVLAGVFAPSVALAFGAWRIASIDAEIARSTPVRVGIVQGNLPLFGSHEEELQALFKQLSHHRALVRQRADLIVWSEGSLPGSFDVTSAETQISTLIGDSPTPAIVGGIVTSNQGGAERVWNSALAFAGGKLVGRYDKRVLLPFSEYIPLGEVFPSLYELSPMSGHFSAGDSLAPISIAGRNVSIAICYEDVLPTLVASLVRAGHPELLVNLTNDAWFGDSAEPWIHLALARMRAVEHRRFLVRATNNGVSSLVDPVGRLVARGRMFEDDALLVDARWMTSSTLFSAVGEWPWYAAVVAVAWMAIRPRKSLRSSAPS